MRRALRAVQPYAPLLVVALFFVLILARADWNSSDQYADSRPFVGCYTGPFGHVINLQPNGNITLNGAIIGSYKIDAPVPGKHGYLLDASGFEMTMEADRLLTKPKPISYGYFWPISSDGHITVGFAPDYELRFQRAQHC